ncbi:formate/nitrite transporter family protein [Peptoniphilus equinus]|uniref:Formate/nitrite transporter family protein n=1 Tax=Peptoniphilus equinus TaxID=3016343 RepID=A0ABY7QTB7_9FIRM|nr:formate/nitrite transporter family protein [Peptoniphilus equinus]WBW49706.1 formate/nitrite transporter family protein [Peptoniphilus equinus]
MYKKVTETLTAAALKKRAMFQRSLIAYLVAAAIAGAFIGFGVLTMGMSGAILGELTVPVHKIFSGLIFSMALSLVIFAGGDLFTGNILTLGTGAMNHGLSWRDALTIVATSYIGNFLGAVLLSCLFLGTGFGDSAMGEIVVGLGIAKGTQTFVPLLFKGILCNVLVCLAVYCCNKMSSESGKLIMIVWCILPFVGIGFEHSVANMTVFTLSMLLSPDVTPLMALHNLVPVTIGNIIGGFLVAGGYFYLGENEGL